MSDIANRVMHVATAPEGKIMLHCPAGFPVTEDYLLAVAKRMAQSEPITARNIGRGWGPINATLLRA